MSGEIVRISSEWLDANKFRAYPFDESCANAEGRIPPAVFTDAFFMVTGLSGKQLHVSRVVLGQTSFQLYMAASDMDLGLVADIPYDTPDRTQIPIQSNYEGGVSLDGLLVVGNAKDIKSMQADNTLTEANGKLFYGCCREFSNPGVTGIRIGDKIYRGTVDLVAGEGVDFNVSEGGDGVTTVEITASSRILPSENMIIVDDVTLLREINELYGSPVTMINGVQPDVNGNISLVYPSEDSGGYIPFPASGGRGAIVLQDTTGAQEVCENTLVETIMANISELNDRLSRATETTNAIDMANNVMSISLSRLT